MTPGWMMSLSSHCVALIPVRDFRTGNSRLAQTLDENTRNLLGRWMLERVLKAIGNAERIDEIAVLSDSAEVLTLAGEYGAVGLLQESGGLNNDLEIGRSWARERNACSLLIVHGDLPFLTSEEVNAFLEERELSENSGRDIRIARSKDGGTTALFTQPIDAIPFLFGEQSFEKHRTAARERGCEAQSCNSFGFAHDIDSPEDLEFLLSLEKEAPEWLASAPMR